MSNEEYIEIMDNSNFMIDSTNLYDMKIKEVLEKQIPKELKRKGYDKACGCGCKISTFLWRNQYKYCPNCGQAIKWE